MNEILQKLKLIWQAVKHESHVFPVFNFKLFNYNYFFRFAISKVRSDRRDKLLPLRGGKRARQQNLVDIYN